VSLSDLDPGLLESYLAWDERHRKEGRSDPCPRCASYNIDPASPYGWCARCSTERHVQEEEGLVKKGNRKRLATRSHRVTEVDRAAQLAEDDEEFEQYLASRLEHFDPTVCPGCDRRKIDPQSARNLCRYCSEERDLEEAAYNEREKARKLAWWRAHGAAWREPRLVRSGAPGVPNPDEEETLIRPG
jgi:hypothetical protein